MNAFILHQSHTTDNWSLRIDGVPCRTRYCSYRAIWVWQQHLEELACIYKKDYSILTPMTRLALASYPGPLGEGGEKSAW